jgi:hypothetical protein
VQYAILKHITQFILTYAITQYIIALTTENKSRPASYQDPPSGTQKERHPNYNTGEKVKTI